jgi:antitoxin HigA-1
MTTHGVRLKNPPHPGKFLRHEIIEPAGLSVTAAAIAMAVGRVAVSALLNGRARLSPEMALRVEKTFGVSTDTLMRMQNSYEMRKRERTAKVGRRIHVTLEDRSSG